MVAKRYGFYVWVVRTISCNVLKAKCLTDMPSRSQKPNRHVGNKLNAKQTCQQAKNLTDMLAKSKCLTEMLSTSQKLKGRLQSLLRMCDRFVMRSLLITSFQSHGENENTRGRLNRSLLYSKEWWRIKSWHKNCCFESFKIKQLILDSENTANRVA